MNSDEALGRLTRTWSALEFFWSSLVWTLMDCDQEVGQIVTRRMTFTTVLESAAALAIHRAGRDSEEVAAIRRALDKADKARVQRNDLIHSTWYSDAESEGFISTRISKKHGLEAKQQRMSVQDILSVKQQVQDAVTELVTGVLLPFHSDAEIRDVTQEEFDEMLLLGDDDDAE